MNELSNTELDLALKINRHRVFMSRFVIFCLFFIDLLIMYNLWYRWVLYTSSIKIAASEFPNPVLEVDFKGYHDRNQPSPITINQKGSLVSGQNLDHYAIISNPNTNWHVRTLTLEFRFPNETVRQTITNLIPQESRLAAVYRFPKSSGVAFIASISNVEWKRVRYTPVNLTSAIRIEQPRYVSNGFVEEFGESIFNVVNASLKGYWEIPYTIKLYSGAQLAGVTHLSLTTLDSQERREIRAAWNINPNLIDRVEVAIEPWAIMDPENQYITRSSPKPPSGLVD